MDRVKMWNVVAFMVSFLTVGIPYWQIPYSKLTLPDGILGPRLLVVLIAAAALRLGTEASFTRATLVAGLAVPAVIMARVWTDGASDPTSHNLWPFELIIAVVVGLAASLVGSLIGGLLASASGRRNTREQSRR